MKKFSILAMLCMLLVASTSRAQDVRYNFDKDTDFAKLKTYTWVVLKDAKPLDDIQDKQVKAAVDAQLAQKGLTKVDGETADLYVGYQAAIGQEKEFSSYSTDFGYGPGWGRGPPPRSVRRSPRVRGIHSSGEDVSPSAAGL